jgi:anti-sigma factor ChrR (cupin superfamily)
MKQFLLISLTSVMLSVLLAGCTAVVPQAAGASNQPAVGIHDEGPEHHLIFSPGEIEWQDGPASFEPGAEFAVLEGNPGEPGVFTMRIKMPDGFYISPHWHPGVERVTVISGTFHLGSGEELDPESTVPLATGSYTSMPPEMRHYAITEGETIIQLTSVGPWQITYVNPEEDDPRLRD